jgi:peroxiredoxin
VAALDPGVLMPPLPLIDEQGRALRVPDDASETLYVAFKTTCPTCALTWPYLERLREASEGGMRVVGISQDPARETREFQQRHGARIEIGYDPKPWPVSESLGLTTVPTFLLVGAGRDDRGEVRRLGSRADARPRAARRGAGRPGRLRNLPARRGSPRDQTWLKLTERLGQANRTQVHERNPLPRTNPRPSVS